ncbi:MAG TPA: NADH-quinone oxidoreductase subunit NuoB [Pontiellaceae bacterium]|nr:NADH-quinone oxidoreductase subunit NuoB [Pontiellaceae bacterium]HPR82868.1 NADH-quinone oxidoreductase subunit NuoB [Pontiellaceae bacterium]
MTAFKKSPWVIHYDASSCNGCDIEVLACLMPNFDVERFGIINTGNPKHADIFLITGSVNVQNAPVVRNIYAQMPEPKVVVAIGICATSGGIFRECYNVMGGIDTVIPVDVYVPGCAARPEAIIDGVVRGLGVLEEKRRFMKSSAEAAAGEVLINRANLKDVPEILALQKIAYRSEAELYGDTSVPALSQTIEEISADFDRMIFLKAIVNGKIIGSVRARLDGDTAHISRVIVHPYFQGKGLATRLIQQIEQEVGDVRAYEAFTGHQSVQNLHLYGKLGYRQVRTEPFTSTVNWVYLQKERT